MTARFSAAIAITQTSVIHWRRRSGIALARGSILSLNCCHLRENTRASEVQRACVIADTRIEAGDFCTRSSIRFTKLIDAVIQVLRVVVECWYMLVRGSAMDCLHARGVAPFFACVTVVERAGRCMLALSWGTHDPLSLCSPRQPCQQVIRRLAPWIAATITKGIMAALY